MQISAQVIFYILPKRISHAKLLLDELQKSKMQVASEIKELANYQDVEKIVSLAPKNNIIDLIDSKKQELKIANNNEVITKHENLPTIKSLTLTFTSNQLKDILLRNVESISEKYLKEVSLRIADLENHGLVGAEKWLFDGLQVTFHSNEYICPFCGQKTDSVKNTIEGYSQYFSKEYNQLIDDIKSCNNILGKFNLNILVKYILDLHDMLLTHYNFWHIYIQDISKPKDVPIAINNLSSAFEKILEAFNDKTSNPLKKIETDDVDVFVGHWNLVCTYVKDLQEYVASLQPKITKLRSSLRPVDLVKKELRVLEIYKMRYEEPLYTKCERYVVLQHRIEWMQRIVAQLQNDQKTNSEIFLNQYGTKINDYLQNVFCTDFKIENIKDGGYRGRSKDASLNYQLTFKGQPLKLESDDNLSFKNTLSEGDKNTIAFSLFLAKLSEYSSEELAKKIVVFDDPLTSLDLNRRNATINELVKLYQKCSQVIVLSHNLAFLLELYNRKKIKGRDKKVLLIEKQIDKSFIKEYELRDELSTEFADCIEKIEKFQTTCSDEDKEPAINSIRLSLEALLKFKYGRFLPTLDGTFGQIIAQLESNTACTFVDSNRQKVIDDLNELNDMSWRSHHASVDEYTEVSITKEELFRKYVPMTLNLLFGRL